mgnify:CR=1 FL=1|tara:strand:+ start:1568 stop:1819 length:252 start_codon:yes stop_codon:yes gene_type:complete
MRTTHKNYEFHILNTCRARQIEQGDDFDLPTEDLRAEVEYEIESHPLRHFSEKDFREALVLMIEVGSIRWDTNRWYHRWIALV